jgi:prevent-host-death family protein
MSVINIPAAKTNLSRLIDAAAAGEEIVIARAGKPVARLVPFIEPPQSERRRLGVLAGQLKVQADFDEPLSDEELHRFEAP